MEMQRQLLLQNQMGERQTAMQIAWTQEFRCLGMFFGLAAVVLIAEVVKKKNPGALLPALLQDLYLPYDIYMVYGTLLKRIKVRQRTLDTQSTLLKLPKGATYKELEKIGSQGKFFIEK
ncbi:LOW QUALITY PROTEIN: plasminogen receptor (KT) [Amazona ochrocephala]